MYHFLIQTVEKCSLYLDLGPGVGVEYRASIQVIIIDWLPIWLNRRRPLTPPPQVVNQMKSLQV